MKFRIKKDKDEMYFAQYKGWLFWGYVPSSYSFNIKKTREACEKFKDKDKVIETFEL
jgi:hypothetical protein